MAFFKQIAGMAPTAKGGGEGYVPSPLGRLLGVDSNSGYQPTEFSTKYSGDKQVLVLCTEERYLPMTPTSQVVPWIEFIALPAP